MASSTIMSQRILQASDWQVFGMDMHSDKVARLLDHSRCHFFEGDITINREWIEYHVNKCVVILPLVAIATPATYVREPLHVFELDFEANSPIVRAAVKYRKRLVFLSTSEVYGMCSDTKFDPYALPLAYGPIDKPRWIYACSKQLMDRVIAAHGHRRVWTTRCSAPSTGSAPASIRSTAKEGSSRVITEFLGHIVRGEDIHLVDRGQQRRSFTSIY